MPATTEPAQDVLDRMRLAAHPRCVVCGRAGDGGLGLRFSLSDDGGVEACFRCREPLQGYERLLHGGVISSLLDGAMTNCLFAHGIAALTAEMTVRFRHPIALDGIVVVRARIHRSQSRLHVVRAEVAQSGRVKAEATGKFMERSLA